MITGIAGSAAHQDLKILTDFGDTGVLLPLSIVFFIWLLTTSTVRTALFWLLILVLCNVLLGLLKVYFLACPGVGLHSPSGHTGFAIFVYGSLTTALALAVRRRWLRSVIVASGTILVAAIAISRVLLGNHDILEIAIGAAIGGTGLAIFVSSYRHVRIRLGAVILLALAALAIALIFHGERITAEDYLRYLGWQLGLRGEACAFR
jgi:hypothetical protein